MNKPIAVVLHSGGLDSTTCLAIAKQDGYAPHALAFDYGQRHACELRIAAAICSKLGISRTVLKLPIGEMGGSALTDPTIDVPDYANHGKIPITYVPARNLIFLSYAIGLAEVLKAQAVYIGVSCIDYSSYPDCRPAFIESFRETAGLGTQAGIEGHPIAIKAPLIHQSKAETIRLGLQLGVDYETTVSCYQADSKGAACGRCDSCVLRKKGFEEALVADPTRYQ